MKSFTYRFSAPALLLAASLPGACEDKLTPAQQQQITAGLDQNIGGLKKNWSSVTLTVSEPTFFTVVLTYDRPPRSMAEAEKDTKEVARAMLKTLISLGKNPQSEMISVNVHARRDEKGETGADLVRTFGVTRYDFGRDQLVFTPAN